MVFKSFEELQKHLVNDGIKTQIIQMQSLEITGFDKLRNELEIEKLKTQLGR